jgi:hypothetical protein
MTTVVFAEKLVYLQQPILSLKVDIFNSISVNLGAGRTGMFNT